MLESDVEEAEETEGIERTEGTEDKPKDRRGVLWNEMLSSSSGFFCSSGQNSRLFVLAGGNYMGYSNF